MRDALALDGRDERLRVERALARTNVAPSMNAGSIVVIAPLNTIAPECSTTDSGAIRQRCAIVAAYIARMKCVCWMPFGSPVVPDVYMSVSRSPALDGARRARRRSPRRCSGPNAR